MTSGSAAGTLDAAGAPGRGRLRSPGTGVALRAIGWQQSGIGGFSLVCDAARGGNRRAQHGLLATQQEGAIGSPVMRSTIAIVRAQAALLFALPRQVSRKDMRRG